METFLIGLTGPDVGARDTVANLLDLQGWELRELYQHVRESLYDLDPLVGAELSVAQLVDREGWPGALGHRIYGPEVNRLLAEVDDLLRGTGGPDVLVNLLAQELADTGGMPGPENGRRVVVTDIGTAEDAAWVRACGGQVWRVGARDEVDFRTGAGLIDVHLDEVEHPRALAAAVEAHLYRRSAA